MIVTSADLHRLVVTGGTAAYRAWLDTAGLPARVISIEVLDEDATQLRVAYIETITVEVPGDDGELVEATVAVTDEDGQPNVAKIDVEVAEPFPAHLFVTEAA